MKAERFVMEGGRIKTRAHRVLFVDNSPFKPKTVKPKNKYKRKAKNQKDQGFWY